MIYPACQLFLHGFLAFHTLTPATDRVPLARNEVGPLELTSHLRDCLYAPSKPSQAVFFCLLYVGRLASGQSAVAQLWTVPALQVGCDHLGSRREEEP